MPKTSTQHVLRQRCKLRGASRRYLFTLLLLLLTWPSALLAADAQLETQAWYLEDPESALTQTEALEALRSGQGKALQGLRFNLGNRDSHFWVYITAKNISNSAIERVLDTGVSFRAGLTVYQLHGQKPSDIILHTDENANFSKRNNNNLILRTAAFVLEPQQSTELLLDYTSRGSSYMPLTLESLQAYNVQAQHGEVWSAFFYAASLVLLIVFILLGLGLQNRNVLMYAGLFILGLLFIAATEGYAFKYLWPNAPHWNQYAALFLLLFSTGAAFFVALDALAPDTLPRWCTHIVIGLGTVSLALSALCTLLPFSPLIEAGSFLMLLAYLTHFVTVTSWLKHAVKRNLVSLISTLVVVPITTGMLALALFNFDLPDVAFSHGVRVAYFITVTMTLASLVTHITALRLDHDKSMEHALLAAERDAELSREIVQTEHRYRKARELAATRQRLLASTSHDIRQPLTSLRAVIDQLPEELGEQERSVLVRSLDYIESISRTHSHEPTDSAGKTPEAGECYRADLLLHSVIRMFDAEAEASGMSIRVAACSAIITCPPLVLMRILSNLTANAVKHSNGNRILLGCRRIESRLRYDVIDNGRGMSNEEVAAAKNPYHKGENSQGEGLGLAICWQLAAEHNFEIEAVSLSGKGTRLSLWVPVLTS